MSEGIRDMKIVKIKDLGRIITGNTPPRNAPEFYGDSYPFVKATDIESGSKYTYHPEEYYSKIAYEKYKKSLIPKGSTCVVTIGTVGKKMTMAHTDLFINQAMNAIVPFSKYDSEYVYYLMKYNLFQLKGVDSGTTSGRENISKNAFSNIQVSVIENMEHQRRIGSILSAYDNLIEVNNKRIKVLEQMAENLYKEWFVRFRFPGYQTAEFENGIPKGWEQCTVESLSRVLQRGISPDYDDDGKLTVISQKCIRQNIMDIREARQQTKAFKPELNLKDGDTVICSTGTGTLGRVGQIFGEYPNTTFDSHVTLIRAKSEVGKHFLYWTLKEMQPWFMNMGIGSTNQQELYRNTIKNAKAFRPTRQLMMQFESVIEPIHQIIITLINSQNILIKQRDLLLPRLMSGKLEV